METMLHYIQELQRMADDLAGGVADVTRYEEDCEMFLTRMEHFVADNCPAQAAYLDARINETRSHIGYLLRQQGDMERHQALVKQGLSNMYRSIKHPPEMEEEEGDAPSSSYFM